MRHLVHKAANIADSRSIDLRGNSPVGGGHAAGFPSPRTNGLALPDGRVREDHGARTTIFLSLEQRRHLAGRG